MATLEDIKSILNKCKLRRVSIDNIKEDVPLSEQGLDSLDIYNVLLNIEMEYGIKVEDGDFNALKTLKGIVDFVNSKTAK